MQDPLRVGAVGVRSEFEDDTVSVFSGQISRAIEVPGLIERYAEDGTSAVAASSEAVNYFERPCAVAFRRHFENGSATGIEEIAGTLRTSRGGSIQVSLGIEDQTAMAGITA